MKGKVKWFNADKGFGFINRVVGDGEDIFVHYTQILEEGYRSLEEQRKTIEELKDVTLHWKGSSNQRVIDVKRTLETGEVILHA